MSGKHAGARPAWMKVYGIAREVVIVVLAAAVLLALVQTFWMRPFRVTSESMEPTVSTGQFILTSVNGQFERGDIIAFNDPGTWLHGGETVLVKRVIAVGGDHIVCCNPDGLLLLNDEPLVEPYVVGMPSLSPFDVTVPDGHLWVMGDNREHSVDSRAHVVIDGTGTLVVDEFVSEGDVIGKVIWPREGS